MENPCPPSLPSSTAAAAITTSRSSITASIHAPPTAAAATITTTTRSNSNSNSGSNTDPNAGSNSGSSAAIQSSLRQLNKNSYKISKHSGDTGNPGHHHRPQPPPLPPPLPPPPSQQPPPPQPQPPVYNIHKNDFRDVVQKLTGSPAHHSRPSASATAGPKHAPGGGGTERGSPPPAVADLVGSERAVVVPFELGMVDDRVLCYRTSKGSAPATAGLNHAPSPSAVGGGTAGGTSSRLQKIRPPPLAQLTPRPPPSLGPSNPFPQTSGDAGVSAAWARASPLSPLPPLPTVSAAAESPITAYMRCLRSGVVPHQQGLIPSPRGGFSGGLLAPSSPLGFGCVPSPRSACQGVLPPGLMLPPSPTPSPRWGDQ